MSETSISSSVSPIPPLTLDETAPLQSLLDLEIAGFDPAAQDFSNTPSSENYANGPLCNLDATGLERVVAVPSDVPGVTIERTDRCEKVDPYNGYSFDWFPGVTAEFVPEKYVVKAQPYMVTVTETEATICRYNRIDPVAMSGPPHHAYLLQVANGERQQTKVETPSCEWGGTDLCTPVSPTPTINDDKICYVAPVGSSTDPSSDTSTMVVIETGMRQWLQAFYPYQTYGDNTGVSFIEKQSIANIFRDNPQ